MSEILNRFSLEAAKFNGQVLVCLLILWAALVGCALLSINSQTFTDRQRRAWRWIVVGVPLFGLLAYLPFAVRREDLPQFFLLNTHKNRSARKAPRAGDAPGGRIT